MKRYDEFNNVHIKNDLLSREYGKTQANEYSHFKGNPEQGNSSANEVNIINDDREKNGLIGGKRSKYEEQKDEQQKQETINQASQVATTSATSASAVGTTAAVVTGASMVAVGTVGAALAGTVAAGTVADFKYLEATAHSVFYELHLEETEGLPFMLSFENYVPSVEEYKETVTLEEGLNKGSFDGLQPETEYQIKVYVNDITKTEIYNDVIMTEAEYSEPEPPDPEPPVSRAEFKEFYFAKTANYRTNSFDLSFTFEDPDDEMSDFQFTLIGNAGTRVYSLEKTEETQTLYGSSDATNAGVPSFDFTDGSEYSYKFDYAIGNERKIVEEGVVTFTDNSNAKQEFRGVELSREADFLENVIYVTLDFDNDLNHLSDFVFTLKSDVTNYIFNLQTTTDKQALHLQNAIQAAAGGDMGIILEDTSFTYTLTYKEKGVSKSVESEEAIIFEDISGAVQEFRSITIHENANFLDKCFYVTLDFDNDYLHFTDFTLTLFSERNPALTFSLRAVTTKQTINFANALIEEMPITADMVGELTLDDDFEYSFSYKDKGTEVTTESQNTFSFYDESGAKSEVRGITIDNQANFYTKDIYVTLDMDNDYGYFSNFTLRLQSYGQVTLIYTLEATTEKQTLKFEDADIESVSGQTVDDFTFRGITFYYEFTYYNSHTDDEISSQGQTSFTDNSGRKSEFRGIVFDSEADFAEGIIYYTLNMDNELDEYTGFTLELTWDSYRVIFYDLPGDNSKHSLKLSDGYGSNKPSYYDLGADFDWELSYSYLRKNYHTVRNDDPLTFVDMYNRVSEFRGITIADYYDMMNGTLDVVLDFADDYNVLSNFVLYFYRPYYDGGEVQYDTYSFELSHSITTQQLNLNEQECYFEADTEYEWKLSYRDSRYGSKNVTGTKTIAPMYDFHYADLFSTVVTVGESYYGIVGLGFEDNTNAISYPTITLKSTETDNDGNPLVTDQIDLEKKSGYQYINLTDFLAEWQEVCDNNANHDSGTVTGLPRDINIAYGISMDINGELFEYSTWMTNTLNLHDDSAVLAGEALTTSMSFNNPTFEFKIYGREPFYTNYNYVLEFQVGDDPDKTYTFNVVRAESSFNAVSDTIVVNLAEGGNYEPLLNAMRVSPVTVRLSWESYYTTGAGSITLLENTLFSIN